MDGILWTAAAITALGVIWRQVFRPARRLFGLVADVVEQWRQGQESLRELAQIVARYVVISDRKTSDLDRRVSRLEGLRDLEGTLRDGTDATLGQQLAQALQRHVQSPHDNPGET